MNHPTLHLSPCISPLQSEASPVPPGGDSSEVCFSSSQPRAATLPSKAADNVTVCSLFSFMLYSTLFSRCEQLQTRWEQELHLDRKLSTNIGKREIQKIAHLWVPTPKSKNSEHLKTSAIEGEKLTNSKLIPETSTTLEM